MADIAKIDTVAEANIAKVAGRTTAAGDSVMNILFPAVGGSIIESIQEIEFTIASSAATGTGTISSVTTGNTIVFLDYGRLGGQRQTSTVKVNDHTLTMVTLTNSTTVTATRDTADSFAVTVRATVVEFTSAAVGSVQTGTINITSGASGTDTITSVTTSRSVVIYQGNISDNAFDPSPAGTNAVALTDATTVTCTRPNSAEDTTVSYSVIEFASGVTDSVQEFAILVEGVSTVTNTATISSVTVADSCIFPGGLLMGASGSQPDQKYLAADLTNATTVTATRITGGFSGPTIYGTVVEFASANISSIQRGTDAFGTGDTSIDVTVTSVTVANSMIIATGATSTAFILESDEQYFTSEIVDATTIRFTKGAVDDVVTVSWELTEFA